MSSSFPYDSNHLDISRRSIRALRASAAAAFELAPKQLPRIFFHGLILSLIIAGFWLLDSLKDPVLARITGIEYQPVAKLFSVVVTFLVTCLYDFATSKLRKPDLFHLISVFYGIAFMVLSAFLSDPEVGLQNMNKSSGRLVGWISYVMIETYGSLMVVLFWSFTNSLMNLEEAKGAYGLIISIAQIGAILGSTVATQSISFGIPQLFLAGSMSIFSISLLIKVYHICFVLKAKTKINYDDEFKEMMIDHGQGQGQGENSEVNSEISASNSFFSKFQGFSEGLFLIVKHRYMILVFGISCSYEIVVTILDYQFKILGADASSSNNNGTEKNVVEQDEFANLLGHFGQATNVFSFLISFFGFSFLVHKIGVRNSLMIFPCVLFLAVLVTNPMPSLTCLFIAVSIIKALVFSLHDPVKELLYIPTSVAIKFKAKAWIDVFGSRLAKAIGSFVTYIAYGDATTLRTIAEVPCLVISLGVVYLAYLVGNEFQKLVDNNIRIGENSTTETKI